MPCPPNTSDWAMTCFEFPATRLHTAQPQALVPCGSNTHHALPDRDQCRPTVGGWPGAGRQRSTQLLASRGHHQTTTTTRHTAEGMLAPASPAPHLHAANSFQFAAFKPTTHALQPHSLQAWLLMSAAAHFLWHSTLSISTGHRARQKTTTATPAQLTARTCWPGGLNRNKQQLTQPVCRAASR